MNALKVGLYNALNGAAALTTALGGSYIYDKIAPQAQARPYVIFSFAGGGHENINPSELINVVFLVKAVSDNSSEAGTIDGLIKTALHLQTLTVAGFTNIIMLRENEVDYAETVREGVNVFHGGALYRIRLDD